MSDLSTFVASPFETTIENNSTIVPSDNMLSYTDGDTIRFEIPSFMHVIDPRQCYLKMKISVKNTPETNHIRLKLNEGVGAQGLIDRIRIYDLPSTIQMENIENYAEFTYMRNHYTKNESIQGKRELLEGMELTNVFGEGCLFNAYLDNGIANPITASVDMNPNSLEVAMPLHSGVIGTGNKSMLPVGLLGGVRVEIDTNLSGKCLQNFNDQGLATDVGGKPWGNGTAIVTGVGSANLELLPYAIAVPPAIGIPIDSATNSNADNATEMSNVRVGDEISGITANGLVQVLGVVASFDQIAQAGTFPQNHVVITLAAPYVPAAAANNLPVWTQATAPLGDVFISTAQYNNNVPRLQIENVELVVKQVELSSARNAQLAKQMMSKDGVRLDIMTYQTLRNNVPAQETVSQIQLPSYNTRAKGVVTLPMNNTLTQNLTNNNLATTLDTIDNYQWYVDGSPQPTRAVSLSSLSNPVSTTAQIALWELEKTLITFGMDVRELDDLDSHLAIGRALARYGGVYDLQDTGIALKQEYNTPILNKLMLSFIGHLRTIIINTEGKTVII